METLPQSAHPPEILASHYSTLMSHDTSHSPTANTMCLFKDH